MSQKSSLSMDIKTGLAVITTSSCGTCSNNSFKSKQHAKVVQYERGSPILIVAGVVITLPI